MLDLNEFQTRKQKIDILLKEQGWDVDDRSKVVLEVDTKQRILKNRTISRLMRLAGTSSFFFMGRTARQAGGGVI